MENKPDPVIFLSGKQVYLRPLEKADLPYLRAWSNDPEIRSLTGEVAPMSEAGVEAFFEKVNHEADRIWFAVVLHEDHRIIGEAGLLRMFPAWRTTDLSIILGDRTAWGKGYGTEAILLLMNYAFGALNMHRVSIGVVGFNQSAIRFYEKVGFKQEGIQREGYFYDHQYHDFVMMSILDDEFKWLK